MLKGFLGFILGLLVGGASAYYYSEKMELEKTTQLESSLEGAKKELQVIQEQKNDIENKFNEVNSELELNKERSCYVTAAPLGAPVWIPENIDKIEGQGNGEAIINWQPVKGAKKYIVKIEAQDGAILNTSEVEETTLYIDQVKYRIGSESTQYLVSITAVNGLNQEGVASEKKPLYFNPPEKKVIQNKNSKSVEKVINSKKMPLKSNKSIPHPKAKKKNLPKKSSLDLQFKTPLDLRA